jgi:hypothetical protein
VSLLAGLAGAEGSMFGGCGLKLIAFETELFGSPPLEPMQALALRLDGSRVSSGGGA